MGVRLRSATPGTLLCLAATILLAIVSFNTPLLKSLYFLSATYSSGQYAGTIQLGTLGYCIDYQGTQTCTGPTVGYSFNPNTLFGVTQFNIPEVITKYLTYTLILHVVALGFAVLATILGLLSHISTLSLLCFPTCFASLTSAFSLIALIFDLVIFYIAKTRIDAVSGASASIGICVWLTLAAWLCAGFSGCAYGVGRCCVGSRQRDREVNDRNKDYYGVGSGGSGSGPDAMRLQALRDEQLRKKEQGLPGFQELERTPLTHVEDENDKYLYEDGASSGGHHNMPGGYGQTQGGLRRDGSVLQGVGMGYGRRNGPGGRAAGAAGGAAGAAGLAAGYAAGAHAGGQGYGYGDLPPPGQYRRGSLGEASNAGAAGVGAGGQGVEPPPQAAGQNYGHQQEQYYDNHYGQDYQDPQHNQYNAYSDPYAAQPQQARQHSQYGEQGPQQYDQYGQPVQQQAYGTHDYRTSSPGTMVMPSATPTPGVPGLPVPQPARSPYQADPYHSGGSSTHRQSAGDAYGGYDEGLGAIGMAAQTNAGRHERDYTGSTFGSAPGQGTGQGGGGVDEMGYSNNQLYQPSPHHLQNPHADILRSPTSPVGGQSAVGAASGGYGGSYAQTGLQAEPQSPEDMSVGRPPSYDAAGYQPRPEKSGYQRPQ